MNNTERTEPTAQTAYQMDRHDNVATLLSDAAEGVEIALVGSAQRSQICACGAIRSGHKIAVADIGRGESVVKFGVAIGYATDDIPAGHWVHLHNCASYYDARSSTLDGETGAATDVTYE